MNFSKRTIIEGVVCLLIVGGLFIHYKYKTDKIDLNPRFVAGKVVKLEQAPRSEYRVYYEFYTNNNITVGNSTLEWADHEFFKKVYVGKYFLVKYEKGNPQNNKLLIDYPIK